MDRWMNLGVLLLGLLAANAGPVGFASLNGGTTGGNGGTIVEASHVDALRDYLLAPEPLLVKIPHSLALGNQGLRVASHKTIVGTGSRTTLTGNLLIQQATNVIVRGLIFTNPRGTGDGDGITVKMNAERIWIDHCEFFDNRDGNLDITHGADLITVSWCRFYYRDQIEHRFSNLIGASDRHADEDTGRLRVTFHHNWWGERVRERMPRARFGQVHAFNNYYHAPGNNYCVRAAVGSEILLEANYFEGVRNPWEIHGTTGPTGRVWARDNFEQEVTWGGNHEKGERDKVFRPPYEYSVDPAAEIPARVREGAGLPNL